VRSKRVPNQSAPIRFAALVRVSTEGQEERGESLATQRKQLLAAAQCFGGEIVEWYDGQEHASGIARREIFQRLLRDIPSGAFDALLVADQSRLARNMRDLIEVLDALEKHDLRFFDRHRERDVRERSLSYFEGIIHERQWRDSTERSLINRIERAKRGWPAGGSLPFGRMLVNAGTTKAEGKVRAKAGIRAEWAVDPAPLPGSTLNAQEWIQKAWHLYVYDLRDFRKVAEAMGIGSNKWQTVRERLFFRSGGEHRQQFCSKKCRINEVVVTKVPPLLTDEQVAAARAAARAHKQFRPIRRKNKQPGHIYPFAHYVRCAECGAPFYGCYEDTSSRRKNPARFYRHPKTAERTERCVWSIPALLLEVTGFQLLGFMMSRTENLCEAVARVLGDYASKRTELEQTQVQLLKRRDAVKAQSERLVGLAGRGKLSDDEISLRMAKLRAERLSLEEQLASVQGTLGALSVEVPTDAARVLQHHVSSLVGQSGRAPSTWSLKAQKRLAEYLFGYRDKSLGVFLRLLSSDRKNPMIEAEVRGMVGVGKSQVSAPHFRDPRYRLDRDGAGKLPLIPRYDRFEALELHPLGDEGLRAVLDAPKHRLRKRTQAALTPEPARNHGQHDGRIGARTQARGSATGGGLGCGTRRKWRPANTHFSAGRTRSADPRS